MDKEGNKEGMTIEELIDLAEKNIEEAIKLRVEYDFEDQDKIDFYFSVSEAYSGLALAKMVKFLYEGLVELDKHLNPEKKKEVSDHPQ